MKQRSIAVITTSRADYGHLRSVLHALKDYDHVRLNLIVLGAHLSPEFGNTVTEIEQDGFVIGERIECLLSSDTDVGMAKTIGIATQSLADAFARNRPDLLLLIADRYEMLAPASVALAMRIPIAHIEGGEKSEGAIDDAVRNAITKLSHIHFTPTQSAYTRVINMGEAAWRVHQVGAPSLDQLRLGDLPTVTKIQDVLGIELAHPLLFIAYHPVTLLQNTTAEAKALFAALDRLPGHKLFCFPNADAGSRKLIDDCHSFCRQHIDANLFINLPNRIYWGLLAEADAMLGNSSSGIMESPSLGLPTVNIGIRQRGRERAANIIDARADANDIVNKTNRALSPEFRTRVKDCTNPYGDGYAGERIADILARTPLGQSLLIKTTMDDEPERVRPMQRTGG
ncbi:MAG: UDP-N-acetylglucosamine 2-epimerase [Gammaproteobacteria bacterium]|nr:MAG: UDP-N-acetylglucosamine 2-epimerase [Gammaproteobacteria bacterium]